MYGTATSALAGSVNNVFYFMLAVSAFFLLLITTLVIVFAVKYRRSKHPEAEQIHGSLLLEVTWTVIPFILFMVMFYYGFEGFKALRGVPEDAMLVQVTGRMWDWSFRYENGKTSTKLYVPVYQPVKLVMNSLDVNHSFFIPAFRVKEDVVPGRETYLWFKPQTTGSADVYCAEYCGQRHSYMMTEVVVMEQDDFQVWYATPEGEEENAPVAVVAMDRNACLTCHSLDGTFDTGPTFKGLYGSTRTVLRGTEQLEVTADEDYLRRAILQPDAEYVKDYPRNMPAPAQLSPEEVEEIIAYLRTLAVTTTGETGGGRP